MLGSREPSDEEGDADRYAFPWYDSGWLASFVQAREVVRRVRPDALSEFVDTFEALRTSPDFKVKELPQVFGDAVLAEITLVVQDLKSKQQELHEFDAFGRSVVHNHPFITELQRSIVELAGDAAGEPVEPSYNFVSVYTKLGVCPVHMDAPEAKWTLDLCIDQSEPWPIHLSQIVPWPEHPDLPPDDWEQTIKRDPAHRFDSFTLRPGNAIFFSGSSQWHYRDPHPGVDGEHFCDLVFFHFVPRGMRETIQPANWARLFDIPELAEPEQERRGILRRLSPRRLASRLHPQNR